MNIFKNLLFKIKEYFHKPVNVAIFSSIGLALIISCAALTYYQGNSNTKTFDSVYTYENKKLHLPFAIEQSQKENKGKTIQNVNTTSRGLELPKEEYIPAKIPDLKTLPNNVDLSYKSNSNNNSSGGNSFTGLLPPVGNQGNVGSCASWATTYYLRGWYAKRDGYYPDGGFSPMYTYSQLSKGHDRGSDMISNANIMINEGVDTRSDYFQGDYDYTSQPTDIERQKAFQYRTKEAKTILNIVDLQNSKQRGIQEPILKNEISKGTPLVIGILVDDSFVAANQGNWHVDKASGKIYGAHALVAYAFDSYGLYIVNSWGTDWGNYGFAQLSWNYVRTNLGYAGNITPENYTPPLTDKMYKLSGYILKADNKRNCTTHPNNPDHNISIDWGITKYSIKYKGKSKSGRNIQGFATASMDGVNSSYEVNHIAEGAYDIDVVPPPGYRVVSCKKTPFHIDINNNNGNGGFWLEKTAFISGYILNADSNGSCTTNTDSGKFTGDYSNFTIYYSGTITDGGSQISGSIKADKDSNGNVGYNIPNLPSGSYKITLSNLGGYKVADPSKCRGKGNPLNPSLLNGNPNVDSGFWLTGGPTKTYTISGYILNSDGANKCLSNSDPNSKYTGEDSGVKVQIYSDPGNVYQGDGKLSRGKDGQLGYSLSGLPEGSYKVLISVPIGYKVEDTCRKSGTSFAVSNDFGGAGFWITPTTNDDNGNKDKKVYKLSGYILNADSNGSCTTTSSEASGRYTGPSGLTINYQTEDGKISGSVRSGYDASSKNEGYSISNLPNGKYYIIVKPSEGWSVTTSCRPNGSSFEINNTDQGSAGFWLIRNKFNLQGYLLNDPNSNCSTTQASTDGKLSLTDPGNVLVSYTGPITGYVRAQVDSKGYAYYQVKDLPSGNYKITISFNPSGDRGKSVTSYKVTDCKNGRNNGFSANLQNGDNPGAGLWLTPVKAYTVSGYILKADNNKQCSTTGTTGKINQLINDLVVTYSGIDDDGIFIGGNAFPYIDASGNLSYSFSAPAGTYSVLLKLPSGYKEATSCRPNPYSVKINSSIPGNTGAGFWIYQ